MMNRKPIFEYRLRSVFFRTLFSLLALMVVMMAAFYLFSSHIITSSVSEQNSATNKNLLSKTSDVVDISLKFLEDMIERLTQDSNIISAIAAPDINRTDRSFEIQNLLKGAAAGSDLIADLYFYSPFDNVLYSANQQIYALPDFPDPDIIALCREYTSLQINDVKNVTTHFYNLGGTEYMLRDFPLTGENRMGTMIIRLDSDVFFQLIQGEAIIDVPIYVFDQNGTPLFSGARNYAPDSLPDLDAQALTSGQEYRTAANTGYFLKTSGAYGWTYVYEDRSDISALRAKNLLTTVFPILLALFALSISLSVYIANYIYKPIRNLMLAVVGSSVSHTDDEGRKYHNEVDYLRSSFHQAIQENDELSNTLGGIVPEMENRVILDMLSGSGAAADAAEELLAHVGSKLCGSGQFVMMAVLLISSDSYSVKEMETEIYSIGINNAICKVDTAELQVRVTVVENGVWAVLLKFAPAVSQEAIKAHISALIHAIHGSIRPGNFYVQVGVGRVKDSIAEIPHSYQEALRSVNFAKYLDASPGKDGCPEAEARRAIDPERIKQQIGDITADAAAADAQGAMVKVRHLIDGIIRDHDTLPELTCAFRAFLDILYGMHLQYGMTDNDPIFVSAGDNIDFESIADPETLAERVETICGQHVDILCKYFGKRQNRLIYLAQQYIDENYFNGSLSLNDVADHLGIHPSYLSTLFSTVLQTRFSEYLNIRRVEKAKQHLLQTELSIKQISAQDGFNSVQNFMRVFKRFVGLSPGQYREKLTGR